MSFDTSIGVRNLSGIQASSKTSDGGAGNTGYFNRDNSNDEIRSYFTKDYDNDLFIKTEIEVKNSGLMEYFKELFFALIRKISTFF